ncbi:hypothetical protein [Mycolicibacterium grossiae]|uniref:Transmembrane protein n=1 Tax=Mycolicibacterium grossiae TaxID=1552759 RepID=A0A1E8PZY1_9MYCO|nr:hypothetical protein [Mycolicibacterium grossiae]OFJ51154.1 hypothetical protein BEL07_24350 [Mycolicibacterium grossiae]QEM44495.1 hypothetical protein FZ046_06580 [Mycolicibacterium grossiae]
MLIAAVLCLCAAAAIAAAGLWLLSRPQPGDPVIRVLRSVVPTQLAGAVMLAAGGAAALSAPAGAAVLLLVLCVVGAVGTIGAGCYQAAKSVARQEAVAAASSSCGTGACASCTLSCK